MALKVYGVRINLIFEVKRFSMLFIDLLSLSLRFSDLLHPVDQFIDRIPIDQKQAYLDDVVRRMMQKCIEPNDLQTDDETRPIVLRIKRVVAYARK